MNSPWSEQHNVHLENPDHVGSSSCRIMINMNWSCHHFHQEILILILYAWRQSPDLSQPPRHATPTHPQFHRPSISQHSLRTCEPIKDVPRASFARNLFRVHPYNNIHSDIFHHCHVPSLSSSFTHPPPSSAFLKIASNWIWFDMIRSKAFEETALLSFPLQGREQHWLK